MKSKEWCPQHGYPLPCDKCGMPLSQPQQKEIYETGRKAGYKQKEEEMNCQSVSLADLCLEHRKAGRKEVVDWIENKRHLLRPPSNFAKMGIDYNEWQAQLKEWGIAEEQSNPAGYVDL